MADQPKLGVLLDENAKRDAIHVAIAPVVAHEFLNPGQHVGLVLNPIDGIDAITADTLIPIGIVDPFLTELVHPGQRCWLFLYAQSITSLRHVWTHPAFNPEVNMATGDVQTSTQWLMDWAAKHPEAPGYTEILAQATGGKGVHKYGKHVYLHFDGQNAHGHIPPEFWDHIEVVTGVPVPSHLRATWFNCSY